MIHQEFTNQPFLYSKAEYLKKGLYPLQHLLKQESHSDGQACQ